MPESRCGLLCSQCSYREQMNCPGCVHMSKPFWGDSCPVKSCCDGKGNEHCGEQTFISSRWYNSASHGGGGISLIFSEQTQLYFPSPITSFWISGV